MLKNSAIAKCNTAIIEGVLVPPGEVLVLFNFYKNYRDNLRDTNTLIKIHSFTKNDLQSTTAVFLKRLVKRGLLHKHEIKDPYGSKKARKIYMLDSVVIEFFKYHTVKL